MKEVLSWGTKVLVLGVMKDLVLSWGNGARGNKGFGVAGNEGFGIELG